MVLLRRFLLIGLCCHASIAWAADVDAPKITHHEISMAPAGKPLKVEANILDKSGVFDPTVLFRVGSQGEFERLSMKLVDPKTHLFSAVIPADLMTGNIQYLIEAFDNEGNGPAQYGSVDLPIEIRVVKPNAREAIVPKTDTASIEGATVAPDENTPLTPTTSSTPPAPPIGSGTTKPGPVNDSGVEESGNGLLWLGLSGTAALVLAGAAAGGGAYAYYRYFRTDPTVDEVNIVLQGPVPIQDAP